MRKPGRLGQVSLHLLGVIWTCPFRTRLSSIYHDYSLSSFRSSLGYSVTLQRNRGGARQLGPNRQVLDQQAASHNELRRQLPASPRTKHPHLSSHDATTRDRRWRQPRPLHESRLGHIEMPLSSSFFRAKRHLADSVLSTKPYSGQMCSLALSFWRGETFTSCLFGNSLSLPSRAVKHHQWRCGGRQRSSRDTLVPRSL